MPDQTSLVKIETGWRPGVIGEIIMLQARFYAASFDFGRKFEAKVSGDLSAYFSTYDPAHDCTFRVELDGALAGTVSIQGTGQGGKGQLRWFIVDPTHQGKGIGAALMQEAMMFCRDAGYSTVWLETFKGLDAARSLYERFQFKLTEEASADIWGPDMQRQIFVRETALA